MTMAIIVACKDSFYIVTDNLMTGQSINNDPYYTLNNQKVFFSDKHKIGLCIAGQANLISKQLNRDSVNVCHVSRKFFEYIDTLDVFPIENLKQSLEIYVEEHYPDYHNYFKFQTPGAEHNNDVSYFYGGFKQEDAANTVVIYSHHKGKLEECKYEDDVPFFTNYQSIVESYVNFVLNAPDFPADKTKKDGLTEFLDQHKDYMLKTCIPQACVFVNSEFPSSIGKTLHRVIINATTIEQSYIEYTGFINDANEIEDFATTSAQPFIYTLYRTEAEAIHDNQPAWLVDNNQQFARYIDNTLQNVNIIQTTEQPDVDSREALGAGTIFTDHVS